MPVEISPSSVIIFRHDMKAMQKEADSMIVQQVEDVRLEKALIVADDTEFLCWFFILVAKKTC